MGTGTYARTDANSGYLYAFGGFGFSSQIGTVGRSSIGTDGSSSTFQRVEESVLVPGRERFGHAIIGNQLYVLGGNDSLGFSTAVERAQLE